MWLAAPAHFAIYRQVWDGTYWTCNQVELMARGLIFAQSVAHNGKMLIIDAERRQEADFALVYDLGSDAWSEVTAPTRENEIENGESRRPNFCLVEHEGQVPLLCHSRVGNQYRRRPDGSWELVGQAEIPQNMSYLAQSLVLG